MHVRIIGKLDHISVLQRFFRQVSICRNHLIRLAAWFAWRLWWLVRPKHMVAVYPVVIQCGSILLIRKRLGMSTGWQLPGGGVDYQSESLEQAAAKELFEETGLIGSGFKLIHLEKHHARRDVHAVYSVNQASGLVRVLDKLEIAEAKFVPLSLADQYLTGYFLRYARLALSY
jgi:8-oxo-dGTP pyrophosphatase MutT (NUDIX family)